MMIFETVEPLLKGNPEHIKVMILTPGKRPPLLKGHILVQNMWPYQRSSTVFLIIQIYR